MMNPTHIPRTWVQVTPDSNGRFDVEAALAKALRQMESPHEVNPEAVILNAGRGANIHDLSRLAEALSVRLPGLPLGVTFGDD